MVASGRKYRAPPCTREDRGPFPWVATAEIAVEKGELMLLAPISARRQLNEPSDDMATKISILYYADAYYADAREALAKALGD